MVTHPSGERMTPDDSKLVRLLDRYDIDFERIAIDENTIRDFEMEPLLEITDPETLAKLRRDPNCEWIKRKHHGLLWQIEVDALHMDLNRFTTLVLSNIHNILTRLFMKIRLIRLGMTIVLTVSG